MYSLLIFPELKRSRTLKRTPKKLKKSRTLKRTPKKLKMSSKRRRSKKQSCEHTKNFSCFHSEQTLIVNGKQQHKKQNKCKCYECGTDF